MSVNSSSPEAQTKAIGDKRLASTPLELSHSNDGKRRQVHFWIASRDYTFLRTLADREDESIANILRRMVRQLRNASDANPLKRGV